MNLIIKSLTVLKRHENVDFQSDLSPFVTNLMPLLNFYPLLESFVRDCQGKIPVEEANLQEELKQGEARKLAEEKRRGEVPKLAENLKLDYNERSKKTEVDLKQAKSHGLDQWKTILGLSFLQEIFKF
jgi:hypothetical protein